MRPTLLALIGTAAIGLPASVPASDWSCGYIDSRNAEVEVQPGDRIEVEAGAGSLDILGVPGADRVSVRGEACAFTEGLLDEIRLYAERSGNQILVRAEIPRRRAFLWWFSRARLDLEIEVPDDVPLQVRDGSGHLEITGVDSLELRDASGTIRVRDVAGDVSIRDGSGALLVSNVRGHVSVEDGSGDIEIEEAGGDVRIPQDGSGDIEIRRVAGDVRIRDGSGEIRVREVEGSVTVDEDGSGTIDVVDVGLDVIVQRDGSGSIIVYDVRGDFEVVADGSGGIDHGRVEGRVRLP